MNEWVWETQLHDGLRETSEVPEFNCTLTLENGPNAAKLIPQHQRRVQLADSQRKQHLLDRHRPTSRFNLAISGRPSPIRSKLTEMVANGLLLRIFEEKTNLADLVSEKK